MRASSAKSIWVVDDDRSIRWVLSKALSRQDWEVRCFEDGEQVLSEIARGPGAWPDLVITDVRMAGIDGLNLLDHLAARAPDLPVIVMTAYSDLDTTVAAFSRGAYEYLPKPFDIDEVAAAAARALQQRPAPEPVPAPERADLIGDSPAMQQVFRQIGRLSRAHLNVLITGETGTGKELIARALHRLGPRREGPFVALNTAAVPHELLESELFGHEKGAFTGAQQRHLGRFEQAHGGTLFLDEIGDMPAPLQTRLLRVLAEHQFYRVGGRQLIEVDVRVVAATHQDLATRVSEGTFRQDLYHRLNVVHIAVPALRERGADILALAEHFLSRAAAESGLEPKRLSPEVRRMLKAHPWPGNVRELENLCRSVTVMAAGQVLEPADVEQRLNPESGGGTGPRFWERDFEHWFTAQLEAPPARLMAAVQDRCQRLMIRAALEHSGGRKEAAAQLLGCGRNTLTRRMKALGMS